jgi:hypothetical protein
VILLVSCTSVGAKTAAPETAASAAKTSQAVMESPAPDVSMEIKIETSRPQPSVGSGLGITAEFRNTSKESVLFLSNESTTLTLPPELEGPMAPIYGRDAFFPTEGNQERANRARTGESGPIIVAIQPGRSYRAAWVFNKKADELYEKARLTSANEGTPWWKPWARFSSSELWQQVTAEVRYLFFVPGDYKVLVQAKVGVNEPLVVGDFRYYTISATEIVKVGAPQFVIILGAMLGGLVSVFLFPQSRPKSITVAYRSGGFGEAAGTALSGVYSVAGACLLSAIVTILLARLSESQFLVKINVNDFWGAVVVGFIAQYAGVSILDKLIPSRLAAARTEPLNNGANRKTASAVSVHVAAPVPPVHEVTDISSSGNSSDVPGQAKPTP